MRPDKSDKPGKRDKRYTMVRALFKPEENYLFSNLFDIVPRTVVGRDLGMNYQTFSRCVEDPGNFNINVISRMAELCHVDVFVLCNKIMEEFQVKAAKRLKILETEEVEESEPLVNSVGKEGEKD